MSTPHTPVLLHETIDCLAPRAGGVYVDATLGAGGHAREICTRVNARIVGIDADSEALAHARETLAECPNSIFIHGNFRHIGTLLLEQGIREIDGAVFDLGVSSMQLDTGERGFSFRADAPLDMRFDPKAAGVTAADIVNEWSRETLEDILRGFADERFVGRIARAIVEAREGKRIEGTGELAEIIAAAVPARFRTARIHPATRTFQALRMAVNDELGALADGLDGAFQLLSSGGRVAVITFHSVEDRAVKNQFKEWESQGVGQRITKRVITPGADEAKANPRARSAKLRCIEKL